MQDALYFSESKEEMKCIHEMHPRHAANAARRLLRECDFWAKEAGVNSDYPELWITGTPLFIALSVQAGQ